MLPSHCWKTVILLVALISFLTTSAGTGGQVARADSPFRPGEKATYQLRWGFIPAGEAVLEVLTDEEATGDPAYHFVLTARSNAFIDPFYKVRDRIDSYADLEMTRSLLYRKKQHEGSTQRDIVVQFDWRNSQAQYVNYGEKMDPISILPGSFDPLAIFFFTRSLDFEEGTEIIHPVTDGKKNMLGQAKIIKRETITVPGGTFDTYLIEPDLKDVGGVFEKSRDAKLKIWVTADERKMLVKIKSKVIVGSFVGELVTIENNVQ